MAKSQLRQQIEAAAPDNDLGWDKDSASLELVLAAISGVTLGASNAAANAGSDAGKAIAVQGVAGGKAVPVSGPLTDTQLRATAVPVSSTTLATSAKQDTGNTALSTANAALGAAADAANANTIIGLLKQIVINTTPTP